MSLEGELLFSGVEASSSFCFSAILNGQKFLHIQLEVFKVFSENVGMCVAIFFWFVCICTLGVFEIIRKYLCHRECLLSLNNSLLFFVLFLNRRWGVGSCI